MSANISRILVPVVFSPPCEHATRYAAALACHFGGELILFHVFVPPWNPVVSPEGYATPPQYDIDAMVGRVRADLDLFCLDHLRNIRVRREIFDGDPAEAIVQFAEAEDCGMIVMPTHGYGPFRRFLLGSVTAKVLHDSRRPVLTSPHMEQLPAEGSPGFRKVMCAIDLGPQSRLVLQSAAAFAREFGAELEVVHVLPGVPAHLEGIYFDPQWQTDLAAGARCRFAALQSEIGIRMHLRVEAGEVPAVLREVAEANGADVLVIGRAHTPGILGRLRANAYAIIRESPCPVLAI